MNKKGWTLVELMSLIVIVGFILLIPLIAIWTGHNLDFWISHFRGYPVHVPFILDLIITVVGNGAVVVGNIISEICKYMV